MSTKALLRALRRRPRVVPAALMLAVSAMFVLAGPVHMSLEALHASAFDAGHAEHDGHHHGEPAGSIIDAACPLGCTDPGHAHQAHDHATCPTCRALGQAHAGASFAAWLPPEAPCLAIFLDCDGLIARAIEAPSARGPPAPLSPVVVS